MTVPVLTFHGAYVLREKININDANEEWRTHI